MNKEHILEEIRRTAEANGGVPLGWRRFEAETGIRSCDWQGKIWARWSEALAEAGFAPNQLRNAYESTELLDKYAELVKELGRIPTANDIRLKDHNDPDFPNLKVYERFGSKSQLVKSLLRHCEGRDEFKDVSPLCESYVRERPPIEGGSSKATSDQAKIGFVYLVKHGSRREYKIGKTFNPIRREGEIAVQLPERVAPIHYIKTDDPSGIESYWHTRFADKRKEGEWFVLTSSDVQAFKRWKRII